MAKTMARIENGMVVNVIWCNASTADSDTLISVGERPVGIGDTYRDGRFWRDGVEVLTPMEELRERIRELEAENADKAAALDAIYLGVKE